ncbi:MAG: CvpA family protein [Anaerolineae bacterium]
MNGFDILIIIALAAGAAWGFIKGLIHQAIGLMMLYASLIVATVFYSDIAPSLQRVVHLEPKAAGAVAFLLLLIICINILGFALREVRNREIKALRLLNQLGGMAFGVVMAGIWIALIIALLNYSVGVPVNWHDPGKPMLATLQAESFRRMIAIGLARSPLVRAFTVLLPYILSSVSPFVPASPMLQIFIIE